jgi:transmembrane sensor
MTRIYDFPPPDKRETEASIWISRLDRGLSDEETKELEAWMTQHRDNQAALFELARLWDRLDSLSRLGDLVQRNAQRSLPARTSLRIAAVTAALGLLGWLGLFYVDTSRDQAMSEPSEVMTSDRTFETAVGEQSTVNLIDGSRVVLNTNTRIKVRYTRQHRLVTLERGEMNIRVAEDSARPLSVVAGEAIIQAVGTEFNVQISADQRIELLVTEGRVLVGVHRPSRSAAGESEPAVLPLSSVTVTAGKELILGSDEERVTEVSPVELEVKLSWQSGNLVFRGESLEEAVEEIGRYTSVEFVILDDELRKVRIAGLFKAGDVDGLLAALRENFDIAYQRTDERIVLLSSK